MSTTLHFGGPARDALLAVARGRSPSEELKCHAVLELLETCQTLGRGLRRELARNQLSETGFRLLAQLMGRESAGVSPAGLAEALGLPRRAVTAVLLRLEWSGLVARERAGSGRRGLRVQATAAGRRAYAMAVRRCLGSINRLMSPLKLQDVATLDHACAQLHRSSTQVLSH
jgi:DNA-binding MarR family transcriptional regulator